MPGLWIVLLAPLKSHPPGCGPRPAMAFRILSNAVITKIGLSVAGIAALKKSGQRRNSSGGMNRLKAISLQSAPAFFSTR